MSFTTFRYFMCSDGYNTIASVGVLFATQELKADAVTLGAMLLLVPFAGFAGVFIWYKIKLYFKLSTKTMLILTTVSMTVLPCFGMLGFIESSPIGLKNTWELYPFAIWFGLNLGAIESFARTIFAQLTPPGREAEFFGFYELTDKGSSWIGPAMTASTCRLRFCKPSVI
jgi:MFS transporter, UMF1 family